MSCAICETRKEKRFCPAVHGRICPVCCGTEREVTLECPSECTYLQQGRKHERPRDLTDSDRAALLPDVDVNEGFLHERGPLLAYLNRALAIVVATDRSVNDRDLISALQSMAKSYHTLVKSGLHFPVTSASPVQQTITAELDKAVQEYRTQEEQRLGYSTVRDPDLLRALTALLRLAYSRTSGRPKSRAFADALAPYSEKQSALVTPEESGNRIVLP